MYKALYRKYRPTSFARVVGQQHVVRTLENAISNQKIGHAYLFHGPRGTGKTSIAKIFSQAVNCTGTGDMPCHACECCKLIDNEQTTDIIELDAASNNGVDEIRLIREYAKYAPTGIKYKVYIIDEVHMLSTAAFNALLKTLEEPPAHVIFILATTEIHKIPMTIISRCQRFDFKNITESEMIGCLRPIIEAEEVEITEEALAYVADYADGGMRDALSVLDQVMAYSNGKIELQDILDVIGTVGVTTYQQLLRDIYAGETTKILETLTEIIAVGKNVQLFVEEFLKYVLKEIEKSMLEQTEFSTESLFIMIEKLNQLAYEMKTAYLPHVALQALFLEITYHIHAEKHKLQIQPQQTVLEKKETVVQSEIENKFEKRSEVQTATATITTAPRQLQETVIETKSESKTNEDDLVQLFDYDYFPGNDEEEIEDIDIVFDFSENKNPIPENTKENLGKLSENSGNTYSIRSDDEVDEPAEQQEIQEKLVETVIQPEPPEPQNAVEEFKAQDIFDTELHVQKIALQLQRTMAEVVIYPEYNQLEKIKRKWQTITYDPNNQVVMMLQDMSPKIATKKEIVLSCFNKSLANQLQLTINLRKAESLISDLMGQEYSLIVTDEATWMKEREIFANKWKANEVTEQTINQLADDCLSLEEQAKKQGYEYVTLDFGTAEEIEEAPVVKEAIELFGDIVEVKE